MKQLLLLSVVAATLLLPCESYSAGRRNRIFRRAPQAASACESRHANHAHRCNPYDYYRALYPKYYGGFHARSLENIGIPTGDVGLRANGMYMLPW
jgi:hypothetical protein